MILLTDGCDWFHKIRVVGAKRFLALCSVHNMIGDRVTKSRKNTAVH